MQAIQGPEETPLGKSRMTASKHVNKLLSVFGLHLRRLPKSPDIPQDLERSTRGHLVELIGPSGVGKSHFHDQLLPEIAQQWLTRRQIRHLMKGSKPFIELESADSDLINSLLVEKRRNIWALDLPVWRKVEMFDFVVRELALDIYARARIVPTAGLFSDEGITHNFTMELIRWHEECDGSDPFCKKALHRFLQGRSVIMLDADDDTILENLKRRHAELQGKQQNDSLALWTEQTVLERIRLARQMARRWLELAPSLGVPVLMVDLDQGPEAGKQKILQFLDDIQHARPEPDPPTQQKLVTQQSDARARHVGRLKVDQKIRATRPDAFHLDTVEFNGNSRD
jgi:hypothetical protein